MTRDKETGPQEAAEAFMRLAFAARARLEREGESGYALIVFQMERGWGLRAQNPLKAPLYPQTLLSETQQDAYLASCKALCASRPDGNGYAALLQSAKELGLAAESSAPGDASLWFEVPQAALYAQALKDKERLDCESLALRRWRSQEASEPAPGSRVPKKGG